MTVVLFMIIIIFIVVIWIQYQKIIVRNKHLVYIHGKLKTIIEKKTAEKLLVMTNDQYLMKILTDINDLLYKNQKTIANHKKTEEELKKMLSNISHDFKTPLTVILGYIEILQMNQELSKEERMKSLKKVQNKTVELLDLINKFFNLAKLESGDQDVPVTKVNLSEVCRKNILSFYDILANKNIEVEINIPKDNVYVLGNEEALNRVLNNLISNAINYGYEGKLIGLDLRVEDEYVYVDVWDKGKGIDEIHKQKVFERLYTLEDSRNKAFQGSGLGLTITKRLIELMDGEITLSSKPYDKTVFSFRLNRISY
ncbi:sensor histidine kinase [Bacillus aquiflavi]|uniref:histidine kinase n=1 Tax=Bacillus aquiflavi TaxID=2672567 RepID=A0A6B3VQZ6_9BACI|nr:ATP-binding protein [Bacillus aquiflavi]MBA4536342.1 sensor histidine kinase [Bacillus aquiflavi]NEY80710.1 sensor histidine kinase [Bacillus aquiflavi]